MEWVVKRAGSEGRGSSGDGGYQGGDMGGGGSPFNDNVVRLRGLPYECTKMDIANFFDGKPVCLSTSGVLLELSN